MLSTLDEEREREGEGGPTVMKRTPLSAHEPRVIRPQDCEVSAEYLEVFDNDIHEAGKTHLCWAAYESARDLMNAAFTIRRLRNETNYSYDLREIARCQQSIQAAGVGWLVGSPSPNKPPIYLCMGESRQFIGAEGLAALPSDWQEAVRVAWKWASRRYKDMIEQNGYKLSIITEPGIHTRVRVLNLQTGAWVGFTKPEEDVSHEALQRAVDYTAEHPVKPKEDTL